MNTRSNILTALFSALGVLTLILDTRTALEGASEGLQLCIYTVIPSLFPFFVLSSMLTGSLLGFKLPFLSGIGKLCRIPYGAENLLMIGFLGGYPVGARSIAQAYHTGSLQKEDALRMLGFCSNAGPSFIFGMAGFLFKSSLYPLLLFLIQILSSLITAFILPGGTRSSSITRNTQPVSLQSALNSALRAISGVCGWIIVFRVLLAFLDRWFMGVVPSTAQVLLSGLLELSNGLLRLSVIISDAERFVLCGAMLSFGGLCVGMQTAAATGGLGMGFYYPGKLLQCCISTVLSISFSHLLCSGQTWSPAVILLPLGGALLITLSIRTLVKSKNNSSNLPAAVV